MIIFFLSLSLKTLNHHRSSCGYSPQDSQKEHSYNHETLVSIDISMPIFSHLSCPVASHWVCLFLADVNRRMFEDREGEITAFEPVCDYIHSSVFNFFFLLLMCLSSSLQENDW